MASSKEAGKRLRNEHFLFKFKGRPVQVYLLAELGGRDDGGAAGPEEGLPPAHLRARARSPGGHLRQTSYSQGLWTSECIVFLLATASLAASKPVIPHSASPVSGESIKLAEVFVKSVEDRGRVVR